MYLNCCQYILFNEIWWCTIFYSIIIEHIISFFNKDFFSNEYLYSWLRFSDLYTKQCFYAHLKVDTSLQLTHSHSPFYLHQMHVSRRRVCTLESFAKYNEYPKSPNKRKQKDLMYREK